MWRGSNGIAHGFAKQSSFIGKSLGRFHGCDAIAATNGLERTGAPARLSRHKRGATLTRLHGSAAFRRKTLVTDPRTSTSAHDQRAVLIVDDDPGTCETFALVLRNDGHDVRSARSGLEALEVSRVWSADLLLVDLQLPDMLGLELVQQVRQSAAVPFVLMSAFLTTEATVAAMRLGAADVVEKPIWTDSLSGLVRSACHGGIRTGAMRRGVVAAHAEAIDGYPASVAERWAMYILRACESPVDLPTVGRWARFVGASTTTLGECCRVLDIRPRDARDLMRLLRALRQSTSYGCRPESMLLVGDARTLDGLLMRAGVTPGYDSSNLTIDRFLSQQSFVRAGNDGLAALRRQLRAFSTN